MYVRVSAGGGMINNAENVSAKTQIEPKANKPTRTVKDIPIQMNWFDFLGLDGKVGLDTVFEPSS
ncbi:MAG: hypothetical protein BroJett039_06970 [Chloroflexota bacterium]|nr:MAG: hypothetical protein BroJett039_06970 [Chloroflexota bacterium]